MPRRSRLMAENLRASTRSAPSAPVHVGLRRHHHDLLVHGAKGGTWPVLTEDTGRIAIDFGVKGLPESFLIDPSGTIVAKFVGGITATGLQPYLTPR